MLTEGQKKLLEELKNNLAKSVPEAKISQSDYVLTGYHLEFSSSKVGMRRVAKEMRSRRFNLETVTAVDFIDSFEIVYLYFNYNQDNIRVMVRIRVPKDEPPFTVSAVYSEAIWLEREVYDFFGIQFKEHPDLRRILNPDDADYFPLLKNFGKTTITGEIDDMLC
ncbi:MAG: NADH-quinone oxidoreductase subunit C [Desulfobacterium sp.]|nr:NADH-quinone oxidoreductase subunit C [Desulfobacterium sp.]MBU3949223.1 NADH-quinone oxidoreductase subunit C [Pseudomonadota bacterium]MBU4009530.1 NADH-quinone oxidoreductase subunit C [Pseudomonadota bacterium]